MTSTIVRSGEPPARVPRCLFVGAADWANICNRLARGMNLLAGERVARVWTLQGHGNGYEEDLLGEDGPALEEARDVASRADWIITTGDGQYNALLAMLALLRIDSFNGRERPALAVTHAGSMYRVHHAALNERDSALGALVRFIGADSLRFATSGPKAVPYWPSCDPIVPVKDVFLETERLTIAHSPTHHVTKGTETVIEVVKRIQADDEYGDLIDFDLIEGVTFAEAAARRAKAHIFIDQLNPEIGGFGASSIEAMAAGCAVLADIRHTIDDWHVRGVASPPIIHVGGADELEDELRYLIRSPSTLAECRIMATEWAEAWATGPALARYFVGHLLAAERMRRWDCMGPTCSGTWVGPTPPQAWIAWPAPGRPYGRVCSVKCGQAVSK